MKKHFLIIGIILFSNVLMEAQTKTKKATIKWGAELKASKKSTLSDIVGYDNTGVYAIKTRYKGLYGLNTSLTLVHLNNEMQVSKEVEIVLKEQKDDKYLEFIVQLKNNLYLFSSFKDKKLKQKFLYVQSINKKTLQLNSDIKKIATIDYSGMGRYNAGTFDYELSRDSSKILIYYHLPYDKGENEKLEFHVFDNGLNQLWEQKVTLPYAEELFGVEDYTLDNNGNVHLLGIIYKEKHKTKRFGEPNYKYQILSYYNSGNEKKEYPVEISGKFLTDMKITVNDESDILCGGFYSDQGTFSIRGCYFITIDSKSKAIKAKNFKEFGLDFITQNMTERQKAKTEKKVEKGKDVEMYRYSLDEILLKDDGGAILIGEQYYVSEVTTTTTDANGNTQTRTTYYYHYNDILVINLSASGTVDWAEKIPKRQVTRNDGGYFSSYVLTIVGDKLFFVFNDNPRNLFYKEGGKLYDFNKSKESLVVLVEVDKEGKQTREALFQTSEAGVLARPKVCEQISGKELIIFGQRGKSQRFAKVTFK